jgi:anti-anti-sigma factor
MLKITVHEKTVGVFAVSPEGSIDTNTYIILEKRIDSLLQSEATVIVFDLSAVTFISSAGIGVILKAQKALKNRNGKVVLMNLQPQVKKVFEIINALPSLSVFASIEELDQYLDHVQRKVTEKK